ncbi:MAG: nuclear transport factor 2 family protein [Fimbriimonas sp.]
MNWNRLQKQALRRHLQRARRGAGQFGRPNAAAGNHGTYRQAIRRTALGLAIAIAITATIVVAKRTDLRSPAVVRYAAWDRAYLAHDVPAMERILAPDFHLDTRRGKPMTRAEYIESLLKSLPKNGYYTRILQLDHGERRSTVWIHVTLPGSDGKPHRYRYRDQWIERNGVWRIIERSPSWNEPHR